MASKRTTDDGASKFESLVIANVSDSARESINVLLLIRGAGVGRHAVGGTVAWTPDTLCQWHCGTTSSTRRPLALAPPALPV